MTDTQTTERFTDAELDEMEQSMWPGERNRVPHLRMLDTPARRRRADAEAGTLTNLRGGRPSDSLADAVYQLLRLIEEGREDEPLTGERTARVYREREQARRRECPAGYERSITEALNA